MIKSPVSVTLCMTWPPKAGADQSLVSFTQYVLFIEVLDACALLPRLMGSRVPANFLYLAQASLAAGWDVISPDEGGLTDEFWDLLLSDQAAGHKNQASGASALGQNVVLRRGQLLHGVDQPVRQFYVLLEVRLWLVP